MTENSTAAAPEATTVKKAVAKKKAGTSKAKKAPKKKAAKKGTAKTAKKAPRAKKEGLRKPQVRILAVLGKSSRGLSRAEISEKGSVDLAMLNSYIGSHDEAARKKNDKNVCMSLLSLGFVKFAAQEQEGRGAYYTITPAGKKALEASKG